MLPSPDEKLGRSSGTLGNGRPDSQVTEVGYRAHGTIDPYLRVIFCPMYITYTGFPY